MKIPGFTAEKSVYTTSRPYRMVQGNHGAMAIQPATMTPQECYRRDSNCTQFCGKVKDPYWRYECFALCNKYLDNCLGTGVWTDRATTLSRL
jgi:hypothetical protein